MISAERLRKRHNLNSKRKYEKKVYSWIRERSRQGGRAASFLLMDKEDFELLPGVIDKLRAKGYDINEITSLDMAGYSVKW